MSIKYIAICILILSNVGISFSQKTLKDNQKEGYIIMADGSRSEVAIEVEDATQPWTYQEGIKYYDRALLTGGRVKRELKKSLVAGEIIEYGFGDRRFIYVNYHVKNKGDDVIKSTVEKIKGDKNSDFFAEIITDGKIRLLKFYQPPVITDADYDDEALIKKITDEAKETYDILISREGIVAKSIQEINYKTFFEDCPAVVKKFDDKRYKIQPVSGIKKLLKSEGLTGPKLELAAKTIVDDYTLKCGK